MDEALEADDGILILVFHCKVKKKRPYDLGWKSNRDILFSVVGQRKFGIEQFDIELE